VQWTMELQALGFASMLATTLPSGLVSYWLRRHHRHLLTDFLKREEEDEMLSYDLMAVKGTHHRYGRR
jgi:hypothetical protein